MYQYNDNELLYLIYEGNEDALGTLFDKYKPLIIKRIKDYKIKREQFDDFFQEGQIALYNAIKAYNPSFNKTFNKFFDLVLQRRFMTVLDKNKKTFYYEILYPGDERLYEDTAYYNDPILSAVDVGEIDLDIDTSNLSEFEQRVFILRYLESFDIDEICKMLECDTKKVYNSIYWIKKKIKINNL